MYQPVQRERQRNIDQENVTRQGELLSGMCLERTSPEKSRERRSGGNETHFSQGDGPETGGNHDSRNGKQTPSVMGRPGWRPSATRRHPVLLPRFEQQRLPFSQNVDPTDLVRHFPRDCRSAAVEKKQQIEPIEKSCLVCNMAEKVDLS